MTFLILKIRSHEQVDVRGSYRIVFRPGHQLSWLSFIGVPRYLQGNTGNLPLLLSKSFRVRYLAVAVALSLFVARCVVLWAFQNIPQKMRFHLILSSRPGVTVTDDFFR